MLVPCYKRTRPEVRGRVDPSKYDPAVWALGEPAAESPDGGPSPAAGEAPGAGASLPVDPGEAAPEAGGEAAGANRLAPYVEPVRGRGRKGR